MITLSTDELNALRYAAGFVPHSLLEKRHGDKYVKFVTCLGVAGDVLSYTEKWFDLVHEQRIH